MAIGHIYNIGQAWLSAHLELMPQNKRDLGSRSILLVELGIKTQIFTQA